MIKLVFILALLAFDLYRVNKKIHATAKTTACERNRRVRNLCR